MLVGWFHTLPLLSQEERQLLPILGHASLAITVHHRYHLPRVLLVIRCLLAANAQLFLPPLGEARQPLWNVPQRRLPPRRREALPPVAGAAARIPPRQGLRERDLPHRGDELGELRERAGTEQRPRGVGRAGEAAERMVLEREDGVGDVGLRAATGLGESCCCAAQRRDVAAGDVGEGPERGRFRGGVAGRAEYLRGGDGGDCGL